MSVGWPNTPAVIGFAICLGMLPACTSSDSAGPATQTTGPAPHGGFVFALPGESGFAEVLIEHQKTSARSKAEAKSQIVVYFLQADRKSGATTLPGDLSVKLITPEGESSSVTLKPEPAASAKDPAGKGRFASPPGKYDYDELRGELTTTIGGQPVAQSFSLR